MDNSIADKDTAPIRELSASFTAHRNAVSELSSSFLEESLLGGQFGIQAILDHCPDAVLKTPLTVKRAPQIDRLEIFTYFYAHARFTSPIYEFWIAFAKKETEVVKFEVTQQLKRRLIKQSEKSWFTKLCWKLGGFEIE